MSDMRANLPKQESELHRVMLSTPSEIWWAAYASASAFLRKRLEMPVNKLGVKEMHDWRDSMIEEAFALENRAKDSFFEASELNPQGIKSDVSFGLDERHKAAYVALEHGTGVAREEAAETEVDPGLFASIDLTNLPADAYTMSINDPRHASLATWCEMLEYLETQIDDIRRSEPEGRAWQELNTLRFTLQSAARLGEQELSKDDFVGWRRSVPQLIDLSSALQKINDIAASAHCQRVLACHFAASWLQHSCDRLEYSTASESRILQLKQLVGDVYVGLATTLKAMNLALIKQQPGLSSTGFVISTHVRTHQEKSPVLVMTPAKKTSHGRQPAITKSA